MNIKIQDKLFFLSGIIGAFILFLGLVYPPTQIYYVLGSTFLLLTAFHFKLIYFIALEMILFAGHGANLLGYSTTFQLALPILLSIQLLCFYYLSGQLNNYFLLIGIAGIAFLSIGFAYENQWIFFLGSSSIAVYAFYCASRGTKITFLWAILNSLFALIAVWKLIFS